MTTRKIDDNTLVVDENVSSQYSYERLLAMKEARERELVVAQVNLGRINFLLDECVRLGITAKEEAVGK